MDLFLATIPPSFASAFFCPLLWPSSGVPHHPLIITGYTVTHLMVVPEPETLCVCVVVFSADRVLIVSRAKKKR
uniref:Putative secreted protein n=1 Tax=Anopheles darlingi TaxID=43151 RepID=A0A2M4DLV8_ANODA